MKHVWLGLATCALVVGLATASLVAKPEPMWICCDDMDQCNGWYCCSPEAMGKLPCDEESGRIGYCAASCVRVNGS